MRWSAIHRHRHLTLNSFFASLLRFRLDCGSHITALLLSAPQTHRHHQKSPRFHNIIQCYSLDSSREAMETTRHLPFPNRAQGKHCSADKCMLSGAPSYPQVVHMHTQLERGTFQSRAAVPLSHPRKAASAKSQFFMAMPTD